MKFDTESASTRILGSGDRYRGRKLYFVPADRKAADGVFLSGAEAYDAAEIIKIIAQYILTSFVFLLYYNDVVYNIVRKEENEI